MHASANLQLCYLMSGVLQHQLSPIWALLLVIAVTNVAQNRGDHGQPHPLASIQRDQMEITIFARFHALEGKERQVASELRDAVIHMPFRLDAAILSRICFDCGNTVLKLRAP
jgi:hypothetical protein